MSFLLPENTTSILLLIGILLTEFFLGFVFIKKRRIGLWVWLFPITAVALIHFLTWYEPAGFRMIALILVLLTGMKVVMAMHYPALKFTFRKWLLYCFAWVGMNPEVFFKSRLSSNQLLFKGLTYLGIGFLLLILLKIGLHNEPIPEGFKYYLFSLILLVALSQILHFGLLNINAWHLQSLHYASYSLFRDPLRAESLRDFWGKRWNLAFTEMTSVAVYRPLSKRLTNIQALLISFLFSGLLHEVALSLPVKTGYGLPLIYFAIQLILVLIEEKIFKRKPGKVWVILGLILPLPILFHPAIMKAVFWQFIL